MFAPWQPTFSPRPSNSGIANRILHSWTNIRNYPSQKSLPRRPDVVHLPEVASPGLHRCLSTRDNEQDSQGPASWDVIVALRCTFPRIESRGATASRRTTLLPRARPATRAGALPNSDCIVTGCRLIAQLRLHDEQPLGMPRRHGHLRT